MQIGLFQLENLSLTPARFVFLDVRTQREPLPAPLARLLTKATPLAASEVETHLKTLNADAHTPIVLLDQDGVDTATLAQTLERKGFAQVYVVAGGVAGLLAEIDPT